MSSKSSVWENGSLFPDKTGQGVVVNTVHIMY